MSTINSKQIDNMKKILIIFFQKHNKMPGLSYLKNKTGLNKRTIYSILSYLKKKKFLLVKNRKIKINSKFFQIKKQERKTIQKQTFDWMTFLKYVLLVIGIGATYMSIYYSDRWLSEFLSPFRSLLLATIMVAFAVSAFELIVFFYRGKRFFLVGTFSVLWFIVTIFSMTSTVAGQYNVRIEKINQMYKHENILSEEANKKEEYQEQKEEYQQKMKILKADIKTLQNILAKENVQENKKQYNTFRWRYQHAKKELNNTIKSLKKLRENKQYKNINKRAPDFYIWMSNIITASPDMIQFWLSVFPAIFIDLIAPISFAIVMFVRRENEK
jgi:hypothetical protein